MPPAGVGLLSGVLAAVLGLGALTVAVVPLWISTPSSDSTLGDALHLAADLWLAAHGASLERTGTLSGDPMPVDVTPLLLTGCLGLLLWRAGRHTTDAYGLAGRRSSPSRVVCWTSAGYLTVLAIAMAYAGTGPLRVTLPSALIWPPLFVGAVLACASRPLGSSRIRSPRAAEGPGPAAVPLPPDGTRLAAARAAVLGLGALLLGGAALTGTAVVWRAPEMWRTVPHLAGDWSGYVAVLLLTLVLLPNALVWSTAYALGPGFTVGGDSLVSPLTTGYPQLPRFPLLAALPTEGPGSLLTWSVGALPAAVAVLTGWYLARIAVPVRGRRDTARGWSGTLGGVLLAAGGCGVAMASLAEVSGGALGQHQLADLGPRGWLTGVAAFGWTVLGGGPAALIVRAWRLRAGRTARTSVVRPEATHVREAATGSAGPALASPDRPGLTDSAAAEGIGDSGLDAAGDLVVDDGGSAAGGLPGVAGWHGDADRRARWAALKEASGGLMSAFDPADLPPRVGDVPTFTEAPPAPDTPVSPRVADDDP
ncbi:hypothetical protein AN216_10880 [Streptomyces oceani]|uniref:Integral membrane protein n=2 Tax=Streptomyces oceani TaxID=1075402 RepID=A0A1E7KI51_9ACTN|nr:hypothetical protein AN216_10880 [Streptomyces oceani]